MSNFLLLKTNAFEFDKIFSNLQKRWYYYVTLLIVLAVIFALAFTTKKKRNNLSKTQKLVYISVMSALAFVANSSFGTIHVSDVLQISLVASVGFIAGYLLGAVGGFAVSFIGDLLCGIIMPFGAYNPIIAIGTGLWGFVPGIIFTYFKGNDFVKASISFATCFLLNSFLINTFGLSVMYTMSFESLLILLPVKFGVVVINAVVSCLMIVVLKKVLPKDKFNV